MIELIPKIKIASLNFKFRMNNRGSDHENSSEILINVEYKICFGMSPTITEAANIEKEHLNLILNCFESKITNGILEEINSIVQLQKINSRGFKNMQYFINIIYLKLGELEFEFPT